MCEHASVKETRKPSQNPQEKETLTNLILAEWNRKKRRKRKRKREEDKMNHELSASKIAW
jgi:urease accessory protein UreE